MVCSIIRSHQGYFALRAMAAGVAAMIGIIACSSGDVTDPPGGECTIPASVPAGAVVVLIKDFAFVPAQVTVRSGGTVAWVNCAPANAESHTATSDAGVWDSPSIAPGAAFVRTFVAQSGSSFDYHCIPHPFMKASVSVE